MATNPILSDIYDHCEVVDEHGVRHKLSAEISRDEGEMLDSIIEQHQFTRTLEIGCAYGLSSLFICGALSRRKSPCHTIIDPFQHTMWSGIGVHNLSISGYDFFELIEMPSEIALPQMLEQKRAFQFALIDGFHTFDHALVDFFYVDRLLEEGGVVVFDDLQLPAINRLARYVSTYPNYAVCAASQRAIVHPPSRKRRLFDRAMHGLIAMMPGDHARRVFSDEFFRPAAEIGLVSEMIAFQKTGAGERGDHWYAEF